MQSLYTTLVSTVTTLLAILAAAVAAYFVFLQDRAAQYDTKVEQDVAAIREAVFALRMSWTVNSFLPPEF